MPEVTRRFVDHAWRRGCDFRKTIQSFRIVNQNAALRGFVGSPLREQGKEYGVVRHLLL